jgi:membrane-associated phospholipid phosphatase
LTTAYRESPADWRRAGVWAAVIASLIYALLFVRFSWGGGAAYLLALLPTVLATLVARSLLAGAFVFLLPVYFVIGQVTASWPHYQPFIWLDHSMPLAPGWILVYGSLYMCGFLLPLAVVRGQELFRQTMKSYLFVMAVSYLGFLLYPTVAPRQEPVAIEGFASWSLQVFYDIDQPYGCFPSLHVAYSIVGALACYRMHRGLGRAAGAWAALIGISTVYTKQHFVIDAIVGAALGAVAYALFLRGRPREPIATADHALAPRRAWYVAGAYVVVIGLFWMAYRLGFGPGSR